MDSTVYGVAKSWTRLRYFHFHFSHQRQDRCGAIIQQMRGRIFEEMVITPSTNWIYMLVYSHSASPSNLSHPKWHYKNKFYFSNEFFMFLSFVYCKHGFLISEGNTLVL